MEYRNIMSGMLKGIRSKHLGEFKLSSFVHEKAKSLLFCHSITQIKDLGQSAVKTPSKVYP